MDATPNAERDFLMFAEDYVRNATPSFTEPYVQYSHEADALFVYVRDEPAYRKRVDAMFTILYSRERKFVGCVVKGIKSLWGDRPPGHTTLEAVFEEYVKRNPKVIWRSSRNVSIFEELERINQAHVCLT